jgi:predicted  nucleic acid-binding Zn-ribbon protein
MNNFLNCGQGWKCSKCGHKWLDNSPDSDCGKCGEPGFCYCEQVEKLEKELAEATAELDAWKHTSKQDSEERRQAEEAATKLFKENKQLRKAGIYLVSFIPDWAKDAQPGLDPTMYGTLTYEGDLKVIAQVEKIRQLLEEK